MIKYIDIPNFGSFQNFDWSTSVCSEDGNVANFKKLNILYGRNYSGKTTLSRIFHSLQTGILPEKYETPSFSVKTDSGFLTQAQIPSSDHDIRVYNKDFVRDHLSFLTDSDGNITPFAVVGSENKIIEKEITEKEKELGNVDTKTGLRHKYATAEIESTEKQRANNKAESDLKSKLTNKATQPPNGIKHNTIYKDPNYNTPKIQTDIEIIRSQSLGILNEKDRRKKEDLLEEAPLSDIEKKIEFKGTIINLHEATEKLLSKKITPTEPIQELLDDAILQAWVKSSGSGLES